MAKAAAEAFARTLAQEERGHGIRVNVIRPGFTESDMASGLLERMTGGTDFRQWDERSPFGRVEQPEDVGGLVAFLVSEAGGYVTNQIIDVDGGQATFFGGRLPFDLDW
jgi:NAD(P)-dependent dehydrogenase (short-subunit alcohol dehydrogenase family)